MTVMARSELLFIPGPVTCAPEVLAAMARPMVDHRGPEYAAVLGRIAAGMRPIFGTAAEIVTLGSSGTGGLEAAVASMFSPGDRVLACPVGVFGRRLAAIARAFGLDVEILETPLGAAVDPAALAERLARPDAVPFAGILLTHNETSTGVQNDMAALARAIGRRDPLVIVDSVSGLGASAFAMDDWGFDVVVTASQKALAVPPGMAMVAVSARAWERTAKARCARFDLDLGRARESAAAGQTPWTPPVSVGFALDVALERYHAAGAAAAHERHARYAAAIRAFAEAAGIAVFSRPGAHSVTVVALEVPAGQNAAEIRTALRTEYGMTFGGGQLELAGRLLRMGTMGDLAPTDVRAGLAALAEELERRGYAGDVAAGVMAGTRVLEEPALAGRA